MGGKVCCQDRRIDKKPSSKKIDINELTVAQKQHLFARLNENLEMKKPIHSTKRPSVDISGQNKEKPEKNKKKTPKLTSYHLQPKDSIYSSSRYINNLVRKSQKEQHAGNKIIFIE